MAAPAPSSTAARPASFEGSSKPICSRSRVSPKDGASPARIQSACLSPPRARSNQPGKVGGCELPAAGDVGVAAHDDHEPVANNGPLQKIGLFDLALDQAEFSVAGLHRPAQNLPPSGHVDVLRLHSDGFGDQGSSQTPVICSIVWLWRVNITGIKTPQAIAVATASHHGT
jgi:hypothetical protein